MKKVSSKKKYSEIFIPRPFFPLIFPYIYSFIYLSYEFLMLFNYLDFISIEMSICFNSFLTLVFIRPNVISEKENLLINEIF